MAHKWGNDKPKIQMLLDVENIFGESTRGLGRFILAIVIAVLPILIIAYFALYLFIPWQILVVVCLVWIIRTMMIVLGDEKARVKEFKKIRDDSFSMTSELVHIKEIHPQGCLEYISGMIAFYVVTYNNSSSDVLGKSKSINRFFDMLVGRHSFDICVQNIMDTSQLDSRYSNVTLFSDAEAANDFMEIIDFNREAVESTSALTRNVIAIYGMKSEWKEMYNDIMTAVHSEAARVFRSCYLVTDRNEIQDIISRDVDGYIDFEELLQRKYYTGRKHGSKIISYDYADLKRMEEVVNEEEDKVSFIPGL